MFGKSPLYEVPPTEVPPHTHTGTDAERKPPAMPTIVITGATSGLGRLAALELARRGAHLILPARSPERAAAVRDEILAVAPATEVDIVPADLTRTADVRRAGGEIAERHPRID